MLNDASNDELSVCLSVCRMLQVHMQEYNAKHAQMKILPRYKVKTEGEAVRYCCDFVQGRIKPKLGLMLQQWRRVD